MEQDRLSALLRAFSLSVRPTSEEDANFHIIAEATDQPGCILITPRTAAPATTTILFSAEISWGGAQNPLFAALPKEIRYPVAEDQEAEAVVRLLLAEAAAKRCGSASVLNRLAEVLVVRVLRSLIENGAASPGLLGGLADPQISRAITALHEAPGRAWQNADLATIAGLSPSRFAERFAQAVGQPPAAYLRHWRLTLARRDLEQGTRVDTVARRYAYGSSEALARAYRRAYGTSPTGRAA